MFKYYRDCWEIGRIMNLPYSKITLEKRKRFYQLKYDILKQRENSDRLIKRMRGTLRGLAIVCNEIRDEEIRDEEIRDENNF